VLAGRPLLAESLERLDRSDWIDAIVVAAAPGWEEPSILLAEELVASKVVSVVTGGATRAASVRAALAEVPDEALVVLVHDAARPLLSDDVVERVLGPLGEGFDGAVPGLPVSDTLKRHDGGVVTGTVDRRGLAAVQTPQAFPLGVLRAAHAAGDEATDCASLVEGAGGRVRIVEGDARLLKVTTPEDLELVERLLAEG
jgi:2-C-methyl-D-erythritol 4-phosphate cytidylyltransferase